MSLSPHLSRRGKCLPVAAYQITCPSRLPQEHKYLYTFHSRYCTLDFFSSPGSLLPTPICSCYNGRIFMCSLLTLFFSTPLPPAVLLFTVLWSPSLPTSLSPIFFPASLALAVSSLLSLSTLNSSRCLWLFFLSEVQ